ncbi:MULTISPECIES: phosphonate ABC transporter substrate-binding protein [unclassified Photobacterium]|uniref:phosphonate ABC transporter substrate-binding protein n=1 Tax=unclassified Photobacterium TaxID=2628852 RepID=UPI000D154F5B|nr:MULTISPECIES: phosphonate ABC transporter substrate-binding protein [unclassified Photobacterium]PSV25215.1 phosphonate ABC transporter substrate-binding protein [Photobacterium sp. GB-56]PSV29242.1 phosphonate ABC transporter substrate-binding protein [Photobacterium sp. GB-72]PSV32702.1 phosphonate ABC transporter substrate-binding protein [Photobacterium sp. GB-27]PSV42049.1 phosphonate ABC transporter substrate-binding protein [Photobacterium sp. GB-36]PSV50354.1 phosphonate ABC transpo
MLRALKTMVCSLGLLTAATAIPVSAEEQLESLNFGIISTESQQNLKTVWDPFLKDMSDKLGMEVKAYFAPDYAGIIQGMRFDKVDVAWFGNKSAMEAVDRAGGEVFAQTVDSEGNPGYWSLLITHKDSPINSVEDMISQRSELAFGNGDPNSTSGFLVPSYYVFAKNNIQPSEFKRTLNSSHEVNLFAVANQQVDVATNNTESMRRFELTNPEKFANIKVIWQSPLIPSDPIVWRKNLPDSAKNEIYSFFMDYGTSGDEKELAVLKELGWAPFKPSSDLQLLPIRQLALFKQLNSLNKQTSLTKEQASKLESAKSKLAVLNRQMSALEAME